MLGPVVGYIEGALEVGIWDGDKDGTVVFVYKISIDGKEAQFE